MRYSRLSISLILLGASSVFGQSAPHKNIEWIPLQFRQVSGTRPFIPVEMNGKQFLMMVHSNAGSFIATTHEKASDIGIKDLKKEADYGITSEGHVSPLGRAQTTLATFKTGSTEFHDVPLSVFELPQDPPLDGMLGMQWLKSLKVIVDFDACQLGIPASEGDTRREDEALERSGWIAHKMTWEPELHRYVVKALVDGHEASLIPSTVANVVLDINWAKKNNQLLGPAIDKEGGPSGGVVDSYTFKRYVSITIDGQQLNPAWPRTWDLAGYSRSDPSKQRTDGYLGAEFLLTNSGIIDFGSGVLFLKP